MGRISAALIAIGLTSCVNLGSPAKLGMTVSDYQGTCGPDNSSISEWSGPLVGECATKPQEYAVFQDGVIANIYDADGITSAMIDGLCKETNGKCANSIRMFVAERTSLKNRIVSDVRANQRRKYGDALAAFGEGMRSNPPRDLSQAAPTSSFPGPVLSSTPSPGDIAPPGSLLCFLRSKYTSGQNLICNYDCLGSLTPVVQDRVSICQPSITR